MKRIVLVDGENLIYGLRILLGSKITKADRIKLENFNFRGMIEELLSDNLTSEIFWFGARLRRYDETEELIIKSESAISQQAKFMNLIKSQKIQFVKVGYLRARELDPCSKCGHAEWKLAEKGVDVGLAVKLVTESSPKREIVIISADTDLLPAFHAARKLGAKIIHIGYENRPIASLSHASHITRVITLPIARKFINQASK